MDRPRRFRALAALVLTALVGACAALGHRAARVDDAKPRVPNGADVAVDDAAGARADEWLAVRGNRILLRGAPFHGRGANLHDTRSCMACAWSAPDAPGLMRWSDELIDHWRANFVRFDLSASDAPQPGQVQWKSLSDDPGYLADTIAVVKHMTGKPGVYVLVTLFLDPSLGPAGAGDDSGWPTDASLARYRLLAKAFAHEPRVLFGLTNEPHGPASADAELAARYVKAIDAIREVEAAEGAPGRHVVVVQAPAGWARDVSYFVAHPIARPEVAYEIHPYNHARELDALVTQPAKALPLIIGEYGPATVGGTVQMTDADVEALWRVAQASEVPYLAWSFHQRCPPNLLQDVGGAAYDRCGLSAVTGFGFARTAWGDLLFAHLQTPW